MRTIGFILQMLGFLVGIGGILVGSISLYQVRFATLNGFGVIIAGAILWALLYAIGAALPFIVDMAIDIRLSREANERSAAALERLAKARSEAQQRQQA